MASNPKFRVFTTLVSRRDAYASLAILHLGSVTQNMTIAEAEERIKGIVKTWQFVI